MAATRLALSSPECHPGGPGHRYQESDLEAEEASRALRIAIAQAMLLNSRVVPAAAGHEALAAAAAGGHVSIVTVRDSGWALLEEPRVDGAACAIEELSRPDRSHNVAARNASDRLLVHQPAVLCALALPQLDVSPRHPWALTAADVVGVMAAAAWRRRRRRAAVLVYRTSDSE